jgi:hypothetical protein
MFKMEPSSPAIVQILPHSSRGLPESSSKDVQIAIHRKPARSLPVRRSAYQVNHLHLDSHPDQLLVNRDSRLLANLPIQANHRALAKPPLWDKDLVSVSRRCPVKPPALLDSLLVLVKHQDSDKHLH